MASLSDKYKNNLPFDSSNVTTIISNYTALNNDVVFVNTASSALTITLPASPTVGSKIKVLDIASNATNNNITILGNGYLVGASSAYKISVVDSSLDLLFISNTKGWLVENSYIPIDLPGKPTSPSAVDVGTARPYNNAAATVTFTVPETGGVPDYYEVVSSPGGISASGGFSPITVTGLQSNTAYTFAVRSKNAAGYSSFSTSSISITTTSVPQSPTISAVTSGFESASVAFNANSTGGSTITGYTVTASPGNATATGSSSPLKLSGLTAGTSYTFTVTATSSKGISAASTASSSVTPFTASGGSITTSGGYRIHTFTGTSNFIFTGDSANIDHLVIAGGGAGGQASSNGAGGGGGAGGLIQGTAQMQQGSYAITIGGGGGGTGGSGGNGGASSIALGASTLVTTTGGGGGGGLRAAGAAGGSGGGGGGGTVGSTFVDAPGGSGTAGQGFSGGASVSSDDNNTRSGGGGGGANAAGTNATGGVGGTGGAGKDISTFLNQAGGTTYRAGGGGGSKVVSGQGGGGIGGGGAGSFQGVNHGVNGTGGGGGGTSYTGYGGNGGSGVIYIRYLT
jgi:hypothetical protein